METTDSGTRRAVWFHDSLWEAIKQKSRQLAAEYDREFSASELIRRACEYALEHPEVLGLEKSKD